MKTKKGIKYKSRRKTILKGRKVTRKGLKHKRRFKRTFKQTFKHLKGGNGSAGETLSRAGGKALQSVARTGGNVLKLVTETTERSVEIAGASVNLGLNVTHGTVDTANIAFLTLNTILQRCLNFVKKRFEESYTQISQCEGHKYASDGECLNSCIKPIIEKFSKNFNSNRPYEYDNLKRSVENTHKLIVKSILYFCKKGRFYGKVCDIDLTKQQDDSRLLCENLKKNIEDAKRKEKNYEFNTRTRVLNGTGCRTTIELCKGYIETLCIPCQQLQEITANLKKQEELLLSWNDKIEKAKEKDELDRLLKTIDKNLKDAEKAEKEKKIQYEQKMKKDEKNEKIASLFKKTAEIETYEREIILIEQRDDIQASITTSKKIVIAIEKTISALQTSTSNTNGSRAQQLVEQNSKLQKQKEILLELEGKIKKIQEIYDRENVPDGTVIGFAGLIERLKEKIATIEANQGQEATVLEQAAVLEEAASGPEAKEANVERVLENPEARASLAEAARAKPASLENVESGLST
jgi:hypothetical protein